MKEAPDIRILVAEDEYLIAREIVSTLESLRFEVVGVAPDGESAVEMVGEFNPDLVMMDIRMPRKDGISAARDIQEKCPTPIIVLTAHESDSLVKEACGAGVSAFLTKPLRANVINRMIAVALARHEDLMKIKRMNQELTEAMAEIESLRGILPICAWCKRIRDDDGYWVLVEEYFAKCSDLRFSHGICPDCLESSFKDIRSENDDDSK